MSKQKQKDAAWAEAKKRCRLSQADIQMAKELGMTPKGLVKNIPSPKQQWKAPVKVWIRDLYEKKFGCTIKTTNHQSKKKQIDGQNKNFAPKTNDIPEEDLPF